MDSVCCGRLKERIAGESSKNYGAGRRLPRKPLWGHRGGIRPNQQPLQDGQHDIFSFLCLDFIYFFGFCLFIFLFFYLILPNFLLIISARRMAERRAKQQDSWESRHCEQNHRQTRQDPGRAEHEASCVCARDVNSAVTQTDHLLRGELVSPSNLRLLPVVDIPVPRSHCHRSRVERQTKEAMASTPPSRSKIV